MDKLLSEDPEAVLVLSGFVTNSEAIITNQLQFKDEFFQSVQIRLDEFYPQFMAHAE